jgi:hypothetical protein
MTDRATPATVAAYVQRLERQLGRPVSRVVVLPDGGIEATLADAEARKPINPADLVHVE